MLDGLKKKIKGAVQGTATKVAGKIAQTSWGIEAMKKEIEKMPMPPQAKQMFLKLVENDPELLTKIANETQDLISKGKNQMAASQTVMMKYQNEIRRAIMGN
jgi:hypothetical protein